MPLRQPARIGMLPRSVKGVAWILLVVCSFGEAHGADQTSSAAPSARHFQGAPRKAGSTGTIAPSRLISKATSFWKRTVMRRMMLRYDHPLDIPKDLQDQWRQADLLWAKGEYDKSESTYLQCITTAKQLNLPRAVLADLLESRIWTKMLSGRNEDLAPLFAELDEMRGTNANATAALSRMDRAFGLEHLSAIASSDLFAAWERWQQYLVDGDIRDPVFERCSFDATTCFAYMLLRHAPNRSYKMAQAAAEALANADGLNLTEYVQRHLDLCNLLCENADFGKAQKFAAEALSKSEASHNNKPIGECLIISAALANVQGDHLQAIALCERAQGLDTIKQSPLLSTRALEILAGASASAAAQSNNPALLDKAINSVRNTLEIQEFESRPHHRRALSHLNIARLLSSQGKDAEAKTEVQRAIDLCIDSSSNADSALALGDAFTELSMIDYRKRDYAAARASISRAIQFHKTNAAAVQQANLVQDLGILALIDARAGDQQSAQKAALEAAATLDRYIKVALPSLSLSEQRAVLSDSMTNTAMMLASVCQTDPSLSEAYRYLLRWKGLLVEGMRRQSQLGNAANDKQYEQLVAQLQRVREEIASASQSGSTLSALTQQKEDLERQVPGVQDPAADISSTSLQQLLAADEALIDILTYRSLSDDKVHYGAIITGKNAPPKFVALGEFDTINNRLHDWRNSGIFAYKARDVTMLDENGTAAPTPSEEAQTAWEKLKSSVWAPLAKALPPTATRLWICEDGELARLPWSMFTLSESTASNLLLCHVDSPRELIVLKKPKPSGSGKLPILIAGAIQYRDPRLNLAGAAQEVKEVQQIAARSGLVADVLTGQQPTRAAVVGKLNTSGVVHLATHGFFTGGSDAARANTRALGVGTTPIPTGDNVAFLSARNPLVRSGVLLAGAAEDKNKEEAKLTAEELVGIDMSKCDLLTLSACDTGRGEEVSGQGVIGLRSAIMAGGARSVLLSIWPVDDEATRYMMRQFYTSLWSKKMSKSEALKQAQLAVKNDTAHPHWKHPVFWSGWQLVGEGWK